MVPLRSELQSGSIVEIICKNNQRPSEDCSKIVKTPSARAKIRSFLRAEEKAKAVDIGKNLFEQELKRHKIPLKKIGRDKIQAVLPQFDKKKIEDFYSALGFGSITPKKAVRPFLPDDFETIDRESIRENRLRQAIQKIPANLNRWSWYAATTIFW